MSKKLPNNIRNLTVSGRIATGTTTLAENLQKYLNWSLLEGGEIFEEFHKKINASETEVSKRPDEIDLEYDEMVKSLLKTQKHQIIQSHLAGFNAQDIDGVFKILVVCEKNGKDAPHIRAKRLASRKKISLSKASEEVLNREKNLLKKWRRLYANNSTNWVYFNKKYYDLVVNTFILDQKNALKKTLEILENSSKPLKTPKVIL